MMNRYLNRSNKPSSEISEEFSDFGEKLRLPRHISALESKTHSSTDRLGKTKHKTKISSQNSSDRGNQAIELAVGISRYQLSYPSQQKHLENLHRNLKHRLKVAVARGDSQLVSILQEEFRQLETNVG